MNQGNPVQPSINQKLLKTENVLKKKLSHKPGSHSYQSLSQFLWHEATRSIATPPGWDASPSQVTPQLFVRFRFPDILLVPIYTPGWREAL